MATFNPNEISFSEVERNVENELARLDPERARGLAGLHRLRSVRATMMDREESRLTRKYGAKHPRVTALQSRRQTNEQFRRDLAFETERAETQTPTVSEKGYIFHGFVLDPSGNGVSQMTIALYDEKGNWIRQLGFGCTDARGYFLMRYEPARKPGGNESNDKAREQAVFEAMLSGSSNAARGEGVRIYVLDRKKMRVHIEKNPLFPRPGQVDYRVIILGEQGGEPCEPPPPTQAEQPTPSKPKPGPRAPATAREPLPARKQTIARPGSPAGKKKTVSTIKAKSAKKASATSSRRAGKKKAVAKKGRKKR